MSIKEFAKKIDGFEYPARELSSHVSEAHDSGFIVIYGQSDDNLIWEGFCVGNRSAFDGCKATIGRVNVEAIWCPTKHPGTSWLISVDCDHEVFRIMEDGEVFCYGAVIDKSAVIGEGVSTREALKELVAIVKIHQEATGNNFAWAELEMAEQALTN
jgi:hypothetical protein